MITLFQRYFRPDGHQPGRQLHHQHPKKIANAKVQTLIALITSVVAIALFSIESQLYENIHRSNQVEGGSVDQELLSLLQQKHERILLDRRSFATHAAPQNISREYKRPETRNGMVKRESLRTTKIVTTDLDLLLMERFDSRKPSKSNRKQNPLPGSTPKVSNGMYPRIVILDTTFIDHNIAKQSSKRLVEPMQTVTSQNNQADIEIIRDYERPYLEQCEETVEREIHPTCNSLHELLLEAPDNIALISTRGSWRSVWKVDLTTTRNGEKSTPISSNNFVKNSTVALIADTFTSTTTNFSNGNITGRQSFEDTASAVVLKMLHIHRTFNQESFRAHETDIMVMDRLTASPYVVNAYGFCGQSVLTEYASSTGREYVKRYDVRNKERFRVVRDLAFGLADIQTLQPLDHSSYIHTQLPAAPILFAHNDINIANIVMVDGKMKWNDFNIGELLRQKRSTFDASVTVKRSSSRTYSTNVTGAGETVFTPFSGNILNETICPVPVKYRSDLWRSPEEIRNNSYVRADLSDMYGFGNILYQTMTRHQPWTHKEPGGKLEKEDVGEKKLEGFIPAIPEQYRNSTTRDLQTMFVATVACYEPDPSKRPSAQRLAQGIGKLYSLLKNKTRISRLDILDHILPYRPS
jgi:Protein kinase domain